MNTFITKINLNNRVHSIFDVYYRVNVIAYHVYVLVYNSAWFWIMDIIFNVLTTAFL